VSAGCRPAVAATGIAVVPDRLAGFARQLGDCAAELAADTPRLARLAAEPSLLAAAVLDPAGALLVAELLTGCLALLGSSYLQCQLLAELVLAAATGYRLADQLDRRIGPVLRAGRQLPAALLAGTRQVSGHGLLGGPRAIFATDPELADLAVGLIAVGVGRVGLPSTPAGLAALVAGLYRDGTSRVTERSGLATDDRRGPPRSLTDLMHGLAVRAEQDDGGGLVDVRVLDGPSGRRVIVDITGTSIWNLDPLRRTPQATDFGTNLRGLAGQDSVMTRGVRQALRSAGVARDDPIMLVGHSQGGLVAARLAAELTADRQYRVTQLVTAGAPLGSLRVPDSVSVLALENAGDPVPQLDGIDNPDRPNWLTIRLPAGADPASTGHSADSYLAGIQRLTGCRDPGLDRWRAGAAGFLTASDTHTRVFQVRRDG
jgi:pimeloyl-ACP methyl ester carboxylesterase